MTRLATLTSFPEASDPFQELPDSHSGLDFAYGAGRIRDDNAVVLVAAGTVTLADDTTNYVECSAAGAVSANTSGFTAGALPLYTVVTASGAITTVTDQRALLSVPGSGSSTYPHQHLLEPETGILTGTWAASSQQSSAFFGKFKEALAQNDAIKWTVPLAAGTHKVGLFVRKSINYGIATISIDGADVGTIDTYSASIVYAYSEVTGITVATSGLAVLKLTMATKHASSSNYRLGLCAAIIARTGA